MDLAAPHNRELVRQMGIELSTAERLSDKLTEIVNIPPPKEKVMRGLNRLSNLTSSIMAQMDAKADAVADKLQTNYNRVDEAISKFASVGDEVAQAADAAEAALKQISNFPDTPPA